MKLDPIPATTTPAPVRRAVSVALPPDRAFALFAERMDTWWPPTHKIGPADLKTITLEPRSGGRWYETDSDGSTCDWGRVKAWEPGRRLLLDWQIRETWAFDAGLHTEIEVTFDAEGTGTRVTVEHRDLGNFGAAAAAMRETFDAETGWPGMLRRFAAAA